jgi:hypothetical protein
MSTEQSTGSPSEKLQRARSKRGDLLEAMRRLEEVAAGPAAEPTGWLASVTDAVSLVGEALQEHIDETESPEGIMAEILREEPRLTAAVDSLRGEHPELVTAWRRTLDAANDPESDRTRIRRRVVSLLGRLAMHRQSGADLVYEAYSVDIGGRG